jgi:murein DD-endopeptidase MepM/ murein hydrolase activator NlpD
MLGAGTISLTVPTTPVESIDKPVYLQKPIPLRSQSRRSRRHSGGSSKFSGFIVVVALLLVNYFLFFQGEDTSVPSIGDQIEKTTPAGADGIRGDKGVIVPRNSDGTNKGSTPQRTHSDEVDDFGEPIGRKIAGKLKRGTTVIRALRSEGIDNRTALPVIRAMQKVFDFRQARVGNAFTGWVDDEGQLKRFTYQHSPLDIYVVELMEDGSYSAKKKIVPTRTEIARIGCAIKSSLYESIKRCGEGNALGGKIIDLFAWDVDFFQDVRTGDEFRVIVEKISVNGKFLRYGKVVAAEYKGKFGRNRLAHYVDPEGNDGYYTPEGRAIRKDFLKSPLKYTMVSAGTQSTLRGNLRKASPVIYTANTGTPIWAVSGGTVVFAGASGSLGITVTIKHDNGFTSTYGHLAALGPGIKTGTLVNQKMVIGSVGKSGNTRSPQLLFSLRKRGRLVNPLKMHATEADPISDTHRSHFKKEVQELLESLDATPIIGVSERKS